MLHRVLEDLRTAPPALRHSCADRPMNSAGAAPCPLCTWGTERRELAREFEQLIPRLLQ